MAQQSNFSLGNPPIRNFSKKTYNASPQNWNIGQRGNGSLVFANNDGLLCFDGNRWSKYYLANRTIVRALAVDNDGSIYVGGQGEFGYFTQKDGKHLQYVDLTKLLPETEKGFSDIWTVYIKNELVFFQSFHNILIYNGKSVETLHFEQIIEKMFIIDEVPFLQLSDGSIRVFENGNFNKNREFQSLQGRIVNTILANNGQYMIATFKDGIFQYDGVVCKPLELPQLNTIYKSWITAFLKLDDGNILIGTRDNGIFILSENYKLLFHILNTNGLQNNTVLNAFQDRFGDLWIATESGIDFIEYKSAYKLILPDSPFNGTGYCGLKLNNQLYLGTNNGLFCTDLSTSYNDVQFTMVDGSKDVCWNLDVIGNRIYLGHNEGASEIIGRKLKAIFRGHGVWKFLPKDNYLVFGSYEGVGVIKNNQDSEQAVFLKDFNESSRIMLNDSDNQLWMSHPYRGIFKLELDYVKQTVTYKKYDKTNGLDSELDHYILMIGKKMYTSNQSGIFYYDKSSDSFVRDTTMENTIGHEASVKLISEDVYGHIWYKHDGKMAFLHPENDGWTKIYKKTVLPSLPENLAGGFEKVIPLSASEFIFNCESGFLLFDKRRMGAVMPYRTEIVSLTLLGSKDSVLFEGIEAPYLHFNQKNLIALSPEFRNLRIDVSTNCFNNESVEYRYKLSGLNKSFSSWTLTPYITYNNLNPGNYTLLIETRIGGIHLNNVVSISFEIKPPWYGTSFFKGLMILISMITLSALFYYQYKRYQKEKESLARIHRQEVNEQTVLVAQSEKQIIELKNQQLLKDINFKNTELASIAMHLAHKKDFISTLEDELVNIQKNKSGSVELAATLKKIIRKMQQESMLDEEWRRFTLYFDELHQPFMNKLKERYPNLTPNDHKLCAYLRMNLSTKEIAALTNISPRGVEGSRYRLRKKMDLANDENLTEIMQQITDSHSG